jgi:hypothetical protein
MPLKVLDLFTYFASIHYVFGNFNDSEKELIGAMRREI